MCLPYTLFTIQQKYMPKYLLISLQELQLRFSTNSPHIESDKTVYYIFSISDNSKTVNKKFNHHLSDAQKYISQNVGYIIAEEYKQWKRNQSNNPSTAKIIDLNNTILIDISKQMEQYKNAGNQYSLIVQRFENNMAHMFYEIVNLSAEILNGDSSSKKVLKKKQQMKNNQILTYQVTYMGGQSQIVISQRYMPNILQHYLLLSDFFVKTAQQKMSQRRGHQTDHEHYYSIVVYGKNNREAPQEYCMATQDRLHRNKIGHYNLCIQIPNVISFKKYVDGQVVAKSFRYQTEQLMNPQLQVQMDGSEQITMNLQLRWGVNLEDIKPQHNILADSHEILIYDIEVKFQSYNEHANTKVKIIYGNKAYQLGGEYNTPKPVKIKKFIHIRVKTEDQQIIIGVQKNLKIIAQSRFYTDELISYSLNYPKRKLIDNLGKSIGYIKFKSEKAKNMSLPHNNKFWKEALKKKYQHPVIMGISQISVNYVHDEPVEVVIKTDTEEKTILNVPNMEYYNNELEIDSQQHIINVKSDQSVYMLVKPKPTGQTNQNDFIGITLLNFNEFLMGENPLQLAFFKNQVKTIILNCIVNKIINYPIIKSTFQPQFLISPNMKTITVSLFIKKIALTPYFYTFQYMKKTEIYGAFNVNRQKKVLILESSAHNQLELVTAASSDNLNFVIEEVEFLIIKIIIFVADLGQDHEVYGTAVLKLRAIDIIMNEKAKLSNTKMITFNNIAIKNLFGVEVGQVSLQVYEGAMQNSHRIDTHDILETPRPKYTKDIRKIKEQMHKQTNSKDIDTESNYMDHYFANSKPNSLNQSLQVKKLSDHNDYKSHNKKSVKLPLIKEIVKPKKKDNYDEFLKMMQVRRRGVSGTYQDGNSLGSYHNKIKSKQKQQSITQRRPRYQTNKTPANKNSSLIKIQRQNPNLHRNLEILFPKKLQKREQIKQQINIYEQKLQGLKSVLNEISQDIGQIEPTINSDPREENRMKDKAQNQYYKPQNKNKEDLFREIEDVEWGDNQFAMNH